MAANLVQLNTSLQSSFKHGESLGLSSAMKPSVKSSAMKPRICPSIPARRASGVVCSVGRMGGFRSLGDKYSDETGCRVVTRLVLPKDIKPDIASEFLVGLLDLKIKDSPKTAIGVIRMGPNETAEKHSHENDGVYVALMGGAEFEVFDYGPGLEKHFVSPGDVLYMPGGTTYSVTAGDEGLLGVNWYWNCSR